MTDLYRHHREMLRNASTEAEANHIIENAFNDYLKDRITYNEYGKIYFACIDFINRK